MFRLPAPAPGPADRRRVTNLNLVSTAAEVPAIIPNVLELGLLTFVIIVVSRPRMYSLNTATSDDEPSCVAHWLSVHESSYEVFPTLTVILSLNQHNA